MTQDGVRCRCYKAMSAEFSPGHIAYVKKKRKTRRLLQQLNFIQIDCKILEEMDTGYFLFLCLLLFLLLFCCCCCFVSIISYTSVTLDEA